MSNDESISLNKFISSTGRCSRREADRLIEAGRVLLNGEVARPGNRVAAGDVVLLDGEPIQETPPSQFVYLALNKPVGITSTTERHIPGNIIDHINYPERIFPVGRLDKASEGLILLTSDGDIVNKILRAGNQHEKEYIVRVNREVTPDFLRKMAGGLPILGTVTKPCITEKIGRYTFRIVLTQGLNRQIRRMCAHLDYEVYALKRIRIMHIELGKLQPGQWRHLSPDELQQLFQLIQNSSKVNS